MNLVIKIMMPLIIILVAMPLTIFLILIIGYETGLMSFEIVSLIDRMLLWYIGVMSLFFQFIGVLFLSFLNFFARFLWENWENIDTKTFSDFYTDFWENFREVYNT